jgi:hypothetical protein
VVSSFRERSALLIQGPILSKGKTGQHFGQGNLPIDDNYFDTTETINSVIRRFAEDFDLVVVATWNTEDTTGIIGGDSVKILRSEAPKKRSRNKREPNSYRQFYSVLKGLDLAEDYGCTLIVKIRTDTSIDASKLLNLCRYRPESIWVVPFQQPNCISDFILAGNLQNLRNLSKQFLRNQFLRRSIHFELFYSYIFFQSNIWAKVRFWNYLPKTQYLSNSQAQLIRHSWESYFSAIPQSIWNEVLWRGFGIPNDSKKNDVELAIKFKTWLDTQVEKSRGFRRFSLKNSRFIRLVIPLLVRMRARISPRPIEE